MRIFIEERAKEVVRNVTFVVSFCPKINSNLKDINNFLGFRLYYYQLSTYILNNNKSCGNVIVGQNFYILYFVNPVNTLIKIRGTKIPFRTRPLHNFDIISFKQGIVLTLFLNLFSFASNKRIRD